MKIEKVDEVTKGIIICDYLIEQIQNRTKKLKTLYKNKKNC